MRTNSNKKSKLSKKAKIIIGIIVFLLCAGGVFAGWLYFYANSKLDKIEKVKVNEDELSIVDVDGYANILLLGVDSRDMKNLKGSRTDAIMIISINEKTKDVKLTSVYRDTFLKMGDTDSYDKITHAAAFDGPALTMKSLNQAMDLNINKFVVVNFKTVADMVDAVGGIEVEIEEYEVAELNRVNEESSRVVGSPYNLVPGPGLQKLDGAQALSYARMRYDVGGDFKRTDRMRVVVTKVFEKVKKSDPAKIDEILDLILPQMKTNLSNKDIFTLASRAAKYKIKGSTGFPYDVQGGSLDGVSYVFPVDLASNVTKLHKDLFGRKNYKPSSKVMEISNTIINKIAGAGAPNPAEVPATVPDAETLKQIPDVEVTNPPPGSPNQPEVIVPNPPPVNPPAPVPEPEPAPAPGPATPPAGQ